MKRCTIELWETELNIIVAALWDRLEAVKTDGDPITPEKLNEIVEVSDVTHNIFSQYLRQSTEAANE